MGLLSDNFTLGEVGKWADSKRRSFFADIVVGMNSKDISEKYEVKPSFVRVWRDRIDKVIELYDLWGEDFGIKKGHIAMATVRAELEYVISSLREAMDMAKEDKKPIVMARVAETHIKAIEVLGKSTGELAGDGDRPGLKGTVTHIIQLPHVGPMRELAAGEVEVVQEEVAKEVVKEASA